MKYIVLLVALISIQCTKELEPKQISVPIKIGYIETGRVDQYITVFGEANASTNLDIYPKINEKVLEVLVKPGQKVIKNQIIAKLDNSIQAKDIDEATTVLNKAKLQLEVATKEFQRSRNLYESNAVTEQSYSTAESNYKTAQISLNQAKSQYGKREEHFSDTYLKSPIEGVVAMVNIKSGDITNVGKLAVKIIDNKFLRAELNIPEKFAGRIKINQEVIANFISNRKEDYLGKVVQIDEVINPETRTLKAVVAINSVHNLKPGSFGKFKIITYKNDSAILIPDNIIRHDYSLSSTAKGSELTPYIYTVEKSMAVKSPLTLGISSNGRTEVLGGLFESDSIVISGYHLLATGTPVKAL